VEGELNISNPMLRQNSEKKKKKKRTDWGGPPVLEKQKRRCFRECEKIKMDKGTRGVGFYTNKKKRRKSRERDFMGGKKNSWKNKKNKT